MNFDLISVLTYLREHVSFDLILHWLMTFDLILPGAMTFDIILGGIWPRQRSMRITVPVPIWLSSRRVFYKNPFSHRSSLRK